MTFIIGALAAGLKSRRAASNPRLCNVQAPKRNNVAQNVPVEPVIAASGA
jgi:hypothetical protein